MYFKILVFLFKALIPESVKVNSTTQRACYKTGMYMKNTGFRQIIIQQKDSQLSVAAISLQTTHLARSRRAAGARPTTRDSAPNIQTDYYSATRFTTFSSSHFSSNNTSREISSGSRCSPDHPNMDRSRHRRHCQESQSVQLKLESVCLIVNFSLIFTANKNMEV